MEDIKWLIRKCGTFFAALLIAVVIGGMCLGQNNRKNVSDSEEIWEPPVEIVSKETELQKEDFIEDDIDIAGASAEKTSDTDLWLLPQAGNSLLTDEEKEQLQNQALSAANQVKEVYKNIEIEGNLYYSSNIKEFTFEQRKEVVSLLGRSDYVGVTEDCNMVNPEKINEFYSAYLDGQDAMVTIFNVNRDGLIGAITFIFRNQDLQTYYVGIGWQEGGIPELQDTLVSDLAEIKLTEKGYFIYAYKEVIAHASLRQYWRVEPLSDKCRELTEKYISGLSYVGYNMLVTNWDSSNVGDILMPCMFEDIYRIYTGKNIEVQNGMIPAEEYESIMTTYFPVSVEQLRENCEYDKDSNSYVYEMIWPTPFPPFGEVIDYRENTDGTITLIVDGVWPDYNSDCAFTNEIIIQPFANGTFRYLSNSITQKKLELPPSARLKEQR